MTSRVLRSNTMTSLRCIVGFLLLITGGIVCELNMTSSPVTNETTDAQWSTPTPLEVSDESLNLTTFSSGLLDINQTLSPPPSTTNITNNETEFEDQSTSPTIDRSVDVTSTDPSTTDVTTTPPTSPVAFDSPPSSTSTSLSTVKWTWFVVTLEGNCSVISRGRQGQGENSLKNQMHLTLMQRLSIESKHDLTISEIKCNSNDRIHVNFTVSVGQVANLSAVLEQLEELRQPLLRLHDVDLYVYQIQLWDGGFLNRDPEIPMDLKHTDVELVIYIAVGSSCAFLLLLASAMLLCKYCCRSSNYSEPKSIDPSRSMAGVGVANVDGSNNCNLRLEDYTLTRIPRPKFGYVDYYRGVTKRYSPLDDKIVTSSSVHGMVQPFDTSLVPLEDVYGQQQQQRGPRMEAMRDGVIIRPSDVRRFGGSLSRIYEARDDEYSARSNEYLHSSKMDRMEQEQGLDNPNFR